MDPFSSVVGTFDENGGLMSRTQVEDKRKKEGKCPVCGQQLFQGRLFQRKPLTIPGKVLSGVCLNCPSGSDGSRNSEDGWSRNSFKRSLLTFSKPKAQSQLQLSSTSEEAINHRTIRHANSLDVDAMINEGSPLIPFSVSSKISPLHNGGTSGGNTLLLSEENSSFVYLDQRRNIILPQNNNGCLQMLTESKYCESDDLRQVIVNMDQCASSLDISGIFELMQAHPFSNLVQAKGCRLVRNLMHASCGFQSDSNSNRWIQALCEIIEDHGYTNHASDSDAACAIAEACGALWSISVLSDDLKISIVKGGITKAVIHAMEVVFRGNDMVLLWSAGLLTSIASCHQYTISSEGALKSVVNILFSCSRQSLQAGEVAAKGVWALSCIHELKNALLSSGAILAVTSIMKRRIEDKIIQSLGCLTLNNLMVDIDGNKSHTKDIQRIVSAVVDAMDYQKSTEIIECGCHILIPCISSYATISIIRRAAASVSIAISNNDNAIIENNINNEALLHSFFGETYTFGMKELGQENLDASHVGDALHVLYLASHHLMLENVFTEEAIGYVLRAVKLHYSNLHVLLVSFNILLLLSDTSDQSRLFIISNGGVDAIVSSMQKNKFMEVIQEKGCFLLTSLCIDKQGNLALLAADWIDAITDAMENHPESVIVQQAACAVVSNFCSSAIISASAEKLVNRVLHAINKFDDSFVILKEEGCQALWGLLSTRRNLSASLTSCEVVVHTVLSAMKGNLDSSCLQEAGCGALCAVASDTSCLRTILDNGGIEVIIDAMTKHLVVGVQENALLLLSALFDHDPPTKLRLLSCWNLIIRTIQIFSNEMNIQLTAIRILSTLTKKTAMRAAVGRGDWIRVLINTMQKNSKDTTLRVAVLTLILQIAVDGQTPRCTKRYVIDTALGAITSNQLCQKTQLVALRTLLSLCSQDKDARSDALSLGAIKIIVCSLRNHLSAKDICGHACGLLWTFALESQSRSGIVNEGGVSIILNAMKAHISSCSLQRKACGALTALTSDGEGRFAARAAGGIDVIVEVMWSQSMYPEVLEEACKVLSNLAVYSGGDTVYIITPEEIEVIASSMKCYLYNQSLQETGCRTLWNYAQIPSNIKILMSFSELFQEHLFQVALDFPACSMMVEGLLDILLS